MSQLGKRLISSAFFVTIAVSTIFLAPSWLFLLVTEALVLLSLNEYLGIAEQRAPEISRPLSLSLGALIPIAFYWSSETMVLVLVTLILFVYHFKKDLRKKVLLNCSLTLLGLVYIAWFFSFVIKLRALDGGAQWVFFTVLIVKGGDAGAYFFGSKFGKEKLIEHISPNKSVEGAFGGFVTTLVLALLSVTYLPYKNLFYIGFLGVMVAIISQLGDLVESLIKRDVEVKDSGQIPGLGGVLDVLDSLLLSVPFVYYYVTMLGVISQ
ncbi:MAG: phosphatidate cytidylyltransferase [Candidatus Omnitrophota bacterium]|nr:phosphatidate cytidylyltransferase [Candidatus Omnitrophota bacterium]